MATSGIMVTLSSDGSNFKFLNNKMSSYKILLPCPLELNGQWEVGLGDINPPDKYLEMSILKDMNIFLTQNC